MNKIFSAIILIIILLAFVFPVAAQGPYDDREYKVEVANASSGEIRCSGFFAECREFYETGLNFTLRTIVEGRRADLTDYVGFIFSALAPDIVAQATLYNEVDNVVAKVILFGNWTVATHQPEWFILTGNYNIDTGDSPSYVFKITEEQMFEILDAASEPVRTEEATPSA